MDHWLILLRLSSQFLMFINKFFLYIICYETPIKYSQLQRLQAVAPANLTMFRLIVP